MALGERIKEHRKNAGLSQDMVAELVGVSRQAVTKWEAEQSAPSTENLIRLAQIFGTTVDQLIAAPPLPEKQFIPESCGPKESDATTIQKQRLTRRKRNLLAALALLGSYLLLYLLLQILFGYPDSSMLGVLGSTDSSLYLWGWLLHSRIFWLALCLGVISAALGKWYFASVTSLLFFAGILAGELLGPYPAGAAYGHDHYGWAIWGGIYLVSIIMGIAAEAMKKRKTPLRSRAAAVWLIVTAAGCIAAVLLVLLSRPDYNALV